MKIAVIGEPISLKSVCNIYKEIKYVVYIDNIYVDNIYKR